MLEQAKDTAQHLAGQVKGQVGQRAESAFDQGKTRAADTLGSVAQTLRQATHQLRDQQQQGASQYVDRAADQLEQLSGYLRTADVHDMADRAEGIARRQPALFLGGMLALGLAGARFLKSSRRNEAQQPMGGSRYPVYAGGGARGLERGPGGYRGASYGGVTDLPGSGSSRSLGDVSGSTSRSAASGGQNASAVRGTELGQAIPGTSTPGASTPGASAAAGSTAGGSTASTSLGPPSLGGRDPFDPTQTARR